MTTTPATRPGEIILKDTDRRAAGIAHFLGARKARGSYFLGGRQADQFKLLYAAGFHVVRRGGIKLLQRDPVALSLYRALAVARTKPPLDSGIEIKHTD